MFLICFSSSELSGLFFKLLKTFPLFCLFVSNICTEHCTVHAQFATTFCFFGSFESHLMLGQNVVSMPNHGQENGSGCGNPLSRWAWPAPCTCFAWWQHVLSANTMWESEGVPVDWHWAPSGTAIHGWYCLWGWGPVPLDLCNPVCATPRLKGQARICPPSLLARWCVPPSLSFRELTGRLMGTFMEAKKEEFLFPVPHQHGVFPFSYQSTCMHGYNNAKSHPMWLCIWLYQDTLCLRFYQCAGTSGCIKKQ